MDATDVKMTLIVRAFDAHRLFMAIRAKPDGKPGSGEPERGTVRDALYQAAMDGRQSDEDGGGVDEIVAYVHLTPGKEAAEQRAIYDLLHRPLLRVDGTAHAAGPHGRITGQIVEGWSNGTRAKFGYDVSPEAGGRPWMEIEQGPVGLGDDATVSIRNAIASLQRVLNLKGGDA